MVRRRVERHVLVTDSLTRSLLTATHCALCDCRALLIYCCSTILYCCCLSSACRSPIRSVGRSGSAWRDSRPPLRLPLCCGKCARPSSWSATLPLPVLCACTAALLRLERVVAALRSPGTSEAPGQAKLVSRVSCVHVRVDSTSNDALVARLAGKQLSAESLKIEGGYLRVRPQPLYVTLRKNLLELLLSAYRSLEVCLLPRRTGSDSWQRLLTDVLLLSSCFSLAFVLNTASVSNYFNIRRLLCPSRLLPPFAFFLARLY